MELFKRKLPSGAFTWYLTYKQDGRYVREKIPRTIQTERDARLYRSKREMELARGEIGLPKDENLSLSACLRRHLASKENTSVPRHFQTLAARVKEMEDFFGGVLPVKSLDEKRVDTFRVNLKEKGDSPETINRKVQFLRTAIDKLVRAGMLAKNPLADMEKLSDSRPPVWRALTEGEVSSLLSTLRDGTETNIKRQNGRNYRVHLGKNPNLHNLVFFLLSTGARCGEAAGLKWKDVDFQRGLLHILTTKRASAGRKAKSRYVPMTGPLRGILGEMARDKGPEEKVFPKFWNLDRKFDRLCELAGVSHCRLHDLRHSAASFLAQSGVPLPLLSEILGHSTVQMTMRYSHFMEDQKVKAMEGLNVIGASVPSTARIIPVEKAAG